MTRDEIYDRLGTLYDWQVETDRNLYWTKTRPNPNPHLVEIYTLRLAVIDAEIADLCYRLNEE